MNKKFSVIVCDPPFSFKDKLQQSDVKRGAIDNYSTMTISEIAELDVKRIADDAGSILALWVPSSLLSDGIRIMNAYGFDLKQNWIWVKTKIDPFKKIKKNKDVNWDSINWDDFLSFGMGRLGRNVHEIALIGTRGKIYKKLENRSQRTVFFYKNEKHSKKPELLQDKLELMFPAQNYLEIFARRKRPGWTCLGNEILNGEDIRDSLKKL